VARAVALAIVLGMLVAGAASAFTASGRFLYEDRRFDGNGYTGAVQNLPIRHARVEIVHAITLQVLGSGVTDAAGNYAIAVNGQALPVSCYARAITDGRPGGYQIRVVDNFVRDIVNGNLVLAGSMLYSIRTSTVLNHSPAQDLDFGTYLTQDTDGTGVAQAFNIFDNGVDFFDWVAQPGMLGSLPAVADSLVYAWKATGTPGNPPPVFGSNYSLQGIFIGAEANTDTDGWSDTVILHETGHWYDDMYSRSDNPGGAHYIGDNDADVLLAYGEGSATYHCAKVRELRATTRTNLVGQPLDNLVSLYADLTLPPAVGTPGGLSFSYDFETGNYGDTGAPIGQIGSANETNVTSALWDMVDGPSTPDATPGVDDESLEVSDASAWGIEHTYLPSMPAANKLTVEDYWQGWFALNGPGTQLAGMQQVFVTNAGMPFVPDAAEPDNTTTGGPAIVPVAHTTSPAGHVVLSEIHMGPLDTMELYNASQAPVDLTGWQLEVFANGTTQDPTRIYTFPAFTLQSGDVVAVHEGGSQVDNGQRHLYAGDQQAFNASWNNGIDGACLLRNLQGTAIDFVRWRDANGVPSSAAVPAGTTFTGVLDSPPAPLDLARDVSGTDTDDASDWTAQGGTLGSANHPSPQAHTIYGIGDVDVVSFVAEAGKFYGFEARGPFSATDPMLELLSSTGQILGSNDDAEPTVRDARLDFFAASSGTYFIRVRHVGVNTDWGEYQLLAFERPGGVLAPPSSAQADPANASDTQDAVTLSWLNAAAYDSVAVYRDSTLVARLQGAPATYVDHANRGVYRYEVSGYLGGAQSGRTRVFAFAGAIGCQAGDDFESGTAAQWITDGTTWDVMPGLAASGAFSFTDSPVGPYGGCHGVLDGCGLQFIATLGVPADLPWGSKLDFDHICITEAGFDFGIVELSADGGLSWTELARYSQATDSRWGDNAAGPTDWRHETIDLASWVGQRVQIRFKLTSDPLLELDGWYVDNVRVNPVQCELLAADGNHEAPRLQFLRPAPNPARGPARLRFVLPSTEERVALTVLDVQGRSRRSVALGPLSAGEHDWTWDGRDDGGRALPSGAYFLQLQVGSKQLVQKLLKLGQ
jgi:hypothetical protein